MLLIIDNYDSFTYNLVQYFGEMGAEMEIYRNDEITIKQINELSPSHICISPGPCTPAEAGMSKEIIETFAASLPILGVCLGHQCIAEVYSAKVVRADRLMHGKTSPIHHNEKGVFAGLENPFEATRYHSLLVDPETVPDELIVTARTAEGEIMGLCHQSFPLHGVQFHPESILTGEGKSLLRNFFQS